MRCFVRRSDLIKPLQLVCGSLGGRLATPILGHLCLTACDQHLQLAGTDGSLEMSARLPLDRLHDIGSAVVPGRKLLEICRMLPDDAVIQFTHAHGKATRFEIRSGATKAWLGTLPTENFPGFEIEPLTQTYDIDTVLLKQLLESVAFSMANQDFRHYLNGLLLASSEGELHATASDGVRLAFNKVELSQSPLSTCALLIPRKAVLELIKFLEVAQGEPCQLAFGAMVFLIKTERYQFVTQLLAGKFPDCRHLLAADVKHHVSLLLADFRQALLRASVLSSDSVKRVRLCFEPGTLILRAKNSADEQVEERLAITGYDDEPTEIGFNVAFLLDVLSALKTSEKVEMEFQGVEQVARLYSRHDPNRRYIVMPMRL